ncbi:cysteine dioxygenase [Rhodococcus rhodnii]|uniref:Cysteine dioxygenase n=2 Tax=Rhodococcus rhodnii TaxID=38312 RepID=R7WSI0_9NOCA|nr:cysteine dioxygenase family protein [Rhodococcus rhodnii]EOM78256.1 cysteine dioxygenase [Rhodococcus rhodnii LMG 5362]TXG89271.1 cysteine dioxygenase [Rhodococcus rhodnii]
MPSGTSSVVSPTRFRPSDLRQLTDRYALDVIDGRYDHVIPESLPTDERWAIRIHESDDVDVWLISWVPDKSTELHDHAGSLGALTVVTGSLSEFRWSGDRLEHRVIPAGAGAGFPFGWVHDVTLAPQPPTDDPVAPTLSVHAYSPPLTAMSYYEVTPRGTLRRTRSELTSVPEHATAPAQGA